MFHYKKNNYKTQKYKNVSKIWVFNSIITTQIDSFSQMEILDPFLEREICFKISDNFHTHVLVML